MTDLRPAAVAIALAAGLLPGTCTTAQTADAMMARGRALTASPACQPGSSQEIVVCGRADATTRYRLPLPAVRERPPVRGGGGSLSAAETLNVPGDCGPSGQRRCTKREAAMQGYGDGRDPLTLGLRLAGRLLDPDGTVTPPVLPRP